MKNAERKRVDWTKYLIEFSLNGTRSEVEPAGCKSEGRSDLFSVLANSLVSGAAAATESYRR